MLGQWKKQAKILDNISHTNNRQELGCTGWRGVGDYIRRGGYGEIRIGQGGQHGG